MFTYYTIIGRNPLLLRGHLKNVTEYAGFNNLACKKKLLVIIYKNDKIPEATTESIIEICKEYEADYFIYNEPTEQFLNNLYNCWNLGYEHALDGFVFRGGSDQVFSRDSFLALYKGAKLNKGKKIILQANTIENNERNMESRHILAPLGDTFEGFDYKKFESLIEEINSKPGIEKLDLIDIQTALKGWGHPTSFDSTFGRIDRCDGCSWLMTKDNWKEFGPIPPVEQGITGDVVIHDRMQRAGYWQYIVKKCITYHFVRGESKGITQS